MQPIEQLMNTLTDSPFDAILIPGTDPHQSEYPPSQWQLRSHFTGFTGSTGHIICTRQRALLTTDSRYAIQVKQEIKSSVIDSLVIPKNESFMAEISWAQNQTGGLKNLAVDPRLFTITQFKQISEIASQLDFKLEFINDTIINKAWPDRPSRALTPIKLRNCNIDSNSREQKIELIQKFLHEHAADFHIISDLESIARTLNFIGFDGGADLLAVCYLIVDRKRATLYIDQEKVEGIDLGSLVDIRYYDRFAQDLKIQSKNKTVIIDARDTTIFVKNEIDSSANIIIERSPTLDIKQVKTAHEIEHMADTHISDAIALAEAFSKLYAILESSSISEYEIGELLDSERAKRPGFIKNSFPPIVGYQGNGAIVHYRAAQNQCAPVQAKGIILIDSGGHYETGTTDITRTLALGDVTDDMIRHYTQVLKGHININRAIFPVGTYPSHIELLARFPLLSQGENYGHGTGHGVGFGTAVHESSEAGLSQFNTTPFQEGWVISNEPGFYREGQYGIRIENLVAVTSVGEGLLGFRQLTMFPYETALIDRAKLSNDELTWINQYHENVYAALHSQTSESAKMWLEERCRPLPLHQ